MVTQSRRLEPAQLSLRLLTLFASRARQGQLSERAFLIFWNLLHKAPVCAQVRPSMLEKLLCEGGLKHARVASCHEPSMHVAYNTHFFEQPLILCTQLAIQFGFFKLLRVCRLGETTDPKHACPISSIWPSANAENGSPVSAHLCCSLFRHSQPACGSVIVCPSYRLHLSTTQPAVQFARLYRGFAK